MLIYFKMTLRMMKRKQAVFWFAFAVYPYNFIFFVILSVYIISTALIHSLLGKHFSLKKRSREFFSVKFVENCFSIFSCLCRIWIFFANPDRTPQKIQKFQMVLCSLKLVLIFQLDIQDICQIQHNFKTLQEANKFIENYEIFL